MRRTILGMTLLAGGLLLLVLPVTGLMQPCWRLLSLDKMAVIRGGHTCMWDDWQPCDGHPGSCYGICADDDGKPETPEVCVRSGQRLYVPGTSEPDYPFCKGSSVEDGYDACEATKTRTVCYQTHECDPDCAEVFFEGAGWINMCTGTGSDVQDAGVHDTFDVDYNSSDCAHE